MRAKCCICTDVFDEYNSISSTHCGHVYHTNCLMVWIGNCKTCPHCRIPLKREEIFKLFIDFDSSKASTSSDLENSVSNLKALLLTKQAELRECQKQKDAIRAFVKEAEKRAADLQQLVYKHDSEIADLRLRVKVIPKLESAIKELEHGNSKMKSEIQLAENVQKVVHGTRKDVEKILQESGCGGDSNKQLATYCSVLKRELEKLMDSKNKLLDMNTKLKLENSRFAAKLKANENKLKRSASYSNFDSPKYAKPTDIPPLASKPRDSPLKFTDELCNDYNNSPLPFKNLKFNLHIKSNSSQSVKVKTSIGKPVPVKNNDENSIIRIGYNGFGGHSNFINTTPARSFKKYIKK